MRDSLLTLGFHPLMNPAEVSLALSQIPETLDLNGKACIRMTFCGTSANSEALSGITEGCRQFEECMGVECDIFQGSTSQERNMSLGCNRGCLGKGWFQSS